MNQDQIKELRRLAEAASQGNYTFGTEYVSIKSPISGYYQLARCMEGKENSDEWNANAAFFANANPANVIALIDHIAELEADAENRESRITALVAEIGKAKEDK